MHFINKNYQDLADLHRMLLKRIIEMVSKFHDHALKLAMVAQAKNSELASMYGRV